MSWSLRRTATAMIIAVAVAASTSCARQAPGAHVVHMKNIGFQPAELTVSRGDTIVWQNEDFVPHTSTARDGSWDSKAINPDSSWRYVTDEAGQYDYYCVFHPNMVGKITVR
ncbi:MAG TPA: cupredoxin family copper-binding protein [Gemmatimonadaceae bacterium]|nr:cupredoxin family copper-binding protein [Gemmatimonadaceae bacterium]